MCMLKIHRVKENELKRLLDSGYTDIPDDEELG